MISVLVHMTAKPGCEEGLCAVCMYNHVNSVKEEGNIAFDFLADKDDPHRFFLYEIWESPEALARHKTTEHYLKWAAALPDYLDAPRTKYNFEVLGLTKR